MKFQVVLSLFMCLASATCINSIEDLLGLGQPIDRDAAAANDPRANAPQTPSQPRQTTHEVFIDSLDPEGEEEVRTEVEAGGSQLRSSPSTLRFLLDALGAMTTGRGKPASLLGRSSSQLRC